MSQSLEAAEYWLEPGGTVCVLKPHGERFYWARYVPITWLLAPMFDMSRSHVERMIKAGAVEIDGRKVTTRDTFIQLANGHLIEINRAPIQARP